MIPKKIHYCWLSGDKKPPLIAACIQSWAKILPDYEIVLWDMNRFDIHQVPFVKQACDMKKWAFAADYIRLYALYHEGGIYMDSDVFVRKSLDAFLDHDFFTAVEYNKKLIDQIDLSKSIDTLGNPLDAEAIVPGIALQAAIMGSEAGHPLIKKWMAHYEHTSFILEDNTLNMQVIAPAIYARIAAKEGFVYKDEQQRIGTNGCIYPSEIFAGAIDEATEQTYAVHCCNGSWHDIRFGKLKRFIRYSKQHPWIRRVMGKKKLVDLLNSNP